MSKSTKTRRCPQCGIVVKSSSLEVLLEHMESSTMCKDAIETCTGCLMKFPDEKTLLKHLSLKKTCQEIYNMGLLDPSIASDFTSSEANRDAASSVAYYHSSGQKRKKINKKEMWGDDSQAPVTNSFATYAFPHVTKKFGTSNSGGARPIETIWSCSKTQVFRQHRNDNRSRPWLLPSLQCDGKEKWQIFISPRVTIPKYWWR
jgi:hypothetical protein